MLKSYKTEINPSAEQVIKIKKTIGVCRYLYNLYIATNKERYIKGEKFMTGYDFDKYINNVHSKEQGREWIKEVSSKARKKSIMNAEYAYKNFFNKSSKFPRFKKRKEQNVSIYLPKNNETDFQVDRHRIKVPTLGYVRVKEFGYIPISSNVVNCHISIKADRYYISVTVNSNSDSMNSGIKSEGVGIDLGIKDFAILSNGMKFKNINKSLRVKELKKRLKRYQRSLSRKYKYNKKKGEATKNIEKQVLKVQKIYVKLTNIRNDYTNKVVNTLVKTKPEYITIEHLNIRGLMKNKHLSKAISEQKFYYFKQRLIYKCKHNGIELREVNTFYPSSKLCSCCGYKKVKLSLSDRIYVCEHCGLIIDRDLNASINLKNSRDYIILTQ